MVAKPRFTFTPNIVRYLSTAVDRHLKRTQGTPPGHELGELIFSVPTYLDEEPFFSFSEKMRLSFVEYISSDKKNIVRYSKGDPEMKMQVRFMHDKSKEMMSDDSKILHTSYVDIHPFAQTHFHIRDIKPILALWKLYLAQKDAPRLAVMDTEIEQVSFDDKEGRLVYLNKSYTLHKGKEGKALRLRLFRKLWDERMHIVNKQTTEKGRPMTLDALTKHLGKRPGKTDISNLGANLKKKGMPIKIQKDGDSVLLVVNEDI